jgi:prolipoprotein diacylglyceryltransferase
MVAYIACVSMMIVFAALYAAEEIARKRGMNRLKRSLFLLQDLSLWMILGALLGGRITYAVGHRAEFHSLGDVLAIWRGGLSYSGGVVGALLAVAFVSVCQRKDRAVRG